MGFISDIGEGVKNTSDSSNENATCKNSEGSSKSTCKQLYCTNNAFSRWKNPKYPALCGRSPFDDPDNTLFFLIH